MKRYELRGTDKTTLEPLCKYFRLDIRDITYIQRAEMTYIHRSLSKRLPGASLEQLIAEIDRLRILLKVRGKRRSLYYVFYWCQQHDIKDSHNYDPAPVKPPTTPSIGDYY